MSLVRLPAKWHHRGRLKCLDVYLLFLDIDGVLHPTSATLSEWFCRAERLAAALAGSPCRVVVSSSWRHHHPLGDIAARLPASLRRAVIGTTGEPCFGRWPRHQEILAFVARHAPDVSWRALDDAWLEFPPGCPQLILCDPNVGIDERQLANLQAWLGGAATPTADEAQSFDRQ